MLCRAERRPHIRLLRDRVQPGRELRLSRVRVRTFDESEKRFLKQILGLRRVAHESQDEVEDRLPVPGEENLEGTHISLLIAEHQAFVWLVPRHRYLRPRWPQASGEASWYLIES